MNIELFTCPNQPGGLRLTAGSCAASYQRGKRAEPWDGAHRCRGCEIGARHAEEVVEPVIAAKPCRLCHNVDGGAKVVYGCMCISCYNRLTEALKGRNAKGRKPQKLSGSPIGGLMMVVKQGVVFAGKSGHLAWMARAPGRLPTAQRSLFEIE